MSKLGLLASVLRVRSYYILLGNATVAELVEITFEAVYTKRQSIEFKAALNNLILDSLFVAKLFQIEHYKILER